MEAEETTGSHLNPNTSSRPLMAKNLKNEDDVANEIKHWIIAGDESSKTYDKAVDYIEFQIDRPLSYWETTCFKRSYVITLLELWLEKSLGEIDKYLNNKVNEISKDMSTVLSQLDSINSFEGIRFKLNDVESPLRDWCDAKCRYLNLILEQKDLLVRFNVFVNCYFQQFKTSWTEKLLSQCLIDIKSETHGEQNEKFIGNLNEFLASVNEDKILLDKMMQKHFPKNDVEDASKTGQDLIKKLVDMFVTCCKNDFLTNIRKDENFKNILDNELDIENVTDWQERFHRLVNNISESCQTTGCSIPEWLTRFEKVSSLLNVTEWTNKLQALTKEICKRFLLPETEIEFKEEDGKRIISIKGVAIFVGRMMAKMLALKRDHPDVEEIKIVGLKSIHIDCNLENEIWHGINIGIITDKLVVDNESGVVCWNVSGKNAPTNQPRGERRQPGESGGNVHVVCNQIINGEKWTIVSDGGDGSAAAKKWTREEFEKSFPFTSTADQEETMKKVLTTLQNILPKDNRRKGKDILPGHKSDFLIEGKSNDGSQITAVVNRRQRQTLILIREGEVGQGGYGGDIVVECFASSEVNTIPFTGHGNTRKTLTAVRLGVYETSSLNGYIGKLSSDVAFLQKDGKEKFYGFEKGEEETFVIEMYLVKVEKEDKYVIYEDENKKAKYAKLTRSRRDELSDLIESAKKQKAVIRQNLVQHFDQIDEWNQMTKSIDKSVSNPMGRRSNNIIAILSKMENKVHELMTQRQEQQLEQEQYVKPVMDSFNSFQNREIISRRPVYQTGTDPMEPNDVHCLDVLPTEDGVLHCLFGRMNSEGKYECNTDRFRQIIVEKFNYNLRQPQTSNCIFKFVLSVEDAHRFPTATAKKAEYWKSIISFNEKYPQMKENEIVWNNWFSFKKREFEKQLFKEQDKWGKDEDLKKEYAKYVESLSCLGTLDLLQLRALAGFFEISIHIYEPHGSSSFKYKETLNPSIYIYKPHGSSTFKYIATRNPSFNRKYFMLDEGNGRWKRLEPNYILISFINEQIKTLDGDKKNCNCWIDKYEDEEQQNCNQRYFETLKSWIDTNQEITNKDDAINKINPKDNKTPTQLFKLLLDRLENTEVNKTKELFQSICLLVDWVDYFNRREVSPLFYVTIVANYKPQEWVREFLLLEMETRLEKPKWDEEDREKWRKKVCDTLINHDRALSLLTKLETKKMKNKDNWLSLDLSKLLQILRVSEELRVKEDDQISLINCFYNNRVTFWQKKIDEWLKTDNRLKKENTPEYINILLKLEYKNKQESLGKFTVNSAEAIKYLVGKTSLPAEQNSDPQKSSNVKEIIAEMKWQDTSNNQDLLEEIEGIVNKSKDKKLQLENCIESIANELIRKNPKKYNQLKMLLEKEQANPTESTEKTNFSQHFQVILKKAKKKSSVEYAICNEITKLTKNFWLYSNDEMSNKEYLSAFLCLYDYVVERIMGFKLRDTQRVAIVTLSRRTDNSGDALAQISTGEGKSIIVAGVAICSAKQINGYAEMDNSKIDVITSNDVLALRDSSLPVAEGGLKELYEFFNVTVANNCSRSVDERQRAYNMDVVYGQLANFQRDHLLDTFYDRNIQGEHRDKSNVIIDEVDCMLLDHGNNVLYLSHDIPGMEMLESLYVFIWEQIRYTPPEMIKSAVLFDLYGQITEKDLNFIYYPLEPEEIIEIWQYLIEKQIIDRQGRLLIYDIRDIKEKMVDYAPTNEALQKKNFNSKITFYLRTVVERKRHIRIPDHLLTFVDRHLDTWLDNARRTLELKQDEDYVIDHDRSDTSPDLNPQVIIIDPETGTDQFNSQWDGALHQFLQLKEGCKLTLQSLKAVFISNSTYINKYLRKAGVSGTLGSQPEKEFLKNKYKCELFTIPAAFPKQFRLKPAKLLKTKESWRKAIIEETRQTIKENRSIVIFCKSIKEVNQIYKQLKSAIPVLRDKIHRYSRDYEKFEFENKKLEIGNVIMTTNLAGRGTDIKISDTLKDNGGLHICLTYFPENERVEKQAMGRAARKGEPGSGILILCDESPTGHQNEECDVEKIAIMRENRKWNESQRISRLGKDFKHTEMLEKLFEEYARNFSEMEFEKNLKRKKKESPKNNTFIQLDDGVLLKFIQNSALDRWALWLDEIDYDIKYFNLKEEDQCEIHLKDYFYLNSEFFIWSTPARRIAIAKELATKKVAREKSAEILNELTVSNDNFFYPAAFYYGAFILLTEIKNNEVEENEVEKRKLILTLRKAETILNEHIDMQISFSLKSKRNPNQIQSFCVIDGYREQKENNIKILQYFIGSIQWILGSHCSISDLREAGSGIPKVPVFFAKWYKKYKNFVENKKLENEELKKRQIRFKKVDDYYDKLFKSKCIVCELNDPNTIPSNSPVNSVIEKATISSEEIQSQIIQQIADDYGLRASELSAKLKEVFGEALNEVEIERELKLEKKIKMKCTRKAFWEKLVKYKVLSPLKEWEFTECVIMLEKQLEELQPKLDRSNAITLEFGIKSLDRSNNRLYVLYNPIYDNKQQLKAANKVMFSKEYVERQLSDQKFNELKKNFESNKIAQLDLNKLKDVKLDSLLGKLNMAQLGFNKIEKYEHEEIWNELKLQKFIDDNGHIAPDYHFTKEFNYPECPAYVDTVMRLVRKKFVAEIVRQQWLKAKDSDDSKWLKAINLLPRKPYRDMLADLMVAHVISGPRVTEDFAVNFKEEINKITQYDQEQDCLMDFLTNRQSVFTTKPIAAEFLLDFIERDLSSTKFSNELFVFHLAGFDRVIDIKDRKWTFRRKLTASLFAPLIVAGGLASIGGGAALTYCSILSFGASKNLFFVGGFSDILYVIDTILSRKDFTWANYGRQRIRGAIGKTEPIDAIKAICSKLSSSSNQSFKEHIPKDERRWKKTDEHQVNN